MNSSKAKKPEFQEKREKNVPLCSSNTMDFETLHLLFHADLKL